MTDSRYNSEEVCRLLWAMRDNELQPSDAERLNAMLLEDHRAREQYVQYMFLSGSLEWDGSASAKEQGADKWVDGEIRDSGFEVWGPENVAGAAVEPPGRIDFESRISNPRFPTLSPLPSHLSPSFVGGPVFSYMVASVVLCMMLFGAWAYKVTLVQPMSPEMAGSPYNRTAPEWIVVGRITDMKDCRWNDEGTGTMIGASVPMGRNYALSAGLLEITYTDGARVILEGPCTYKVDSIAGGYLGLGKLTARVDNAKPQVANHNSSSLIPHPSSLIPLRRNHSHGCRHRLGHGVRRGGRR